MQNILLIFPLLFLFYLLGKAADIVIVNIREIGKKIGIDIFFLGIILGFLTSLPELFIGINSIANDIPEAALGNLFGGIMVIFGFVLGINLILNRKIKTNGEISEYLFAFMYMLFPLLLGLDGKLGYIDGLTLIMLYVYLLYILYVKQKEKNHFQISINKNSNDILKKVFYIIFGIILIIVISELIVKLLLILLNGLNLSIFIIGLILFSFGTNIPELAVSIRSCKKHASDLAISNLVGSAMSNVVIIGIFSFARPFIVEVNSSYFALIFFTISIFAVFLYFYKTERLLTKKEGFALLAIYILFLIVQVGFLIPR